MKQLFNSEGVAYVQAAILALPSSELDTQLQWIRDDFTGWMMSRFELSPAQQTQLNSMPTAFKQELSHSIADTWGTGNLISFSKEGDDEELRDKDIIIFPRRPKVWNVNNGTVNEEIGLDICIRYDK